MEFSDFSPTTEPSIDEQRDALQKGLGRAMQWAMAGKLDKDVLLNACLHDQRYDMQCEANRGEWFWQLMEVSGSTGHFRLPILDALRSTTAERDGYQLSQLALHFAQAGDDEFKSELYQFVKDQRVPEAPWLAEGQLLALDGMKAFRFLACHRGVLLDKRQWDWHDSAVVDRAMEIVGEDQVRNFLLHSDEPAIQQFVAKWPEKSGKLDFQPRRRADELRAIPAVAIIESAKKEDKRISFRGWGMHADESALESVLEAVWAEKSAEVIVKLLQVFSNRPLPHFDARLIDLCQNDDKEVRRRAFQALAMNSHPVVRQFAMAKLSEDATGSVVRLFAKNFEEGDERRIRSALELPNEPFDLHGLVMDIVAVLQANPKADCYELATISYRATPCQNCRGHAARILRDRQVAPKWLVEECFYGSDEPTRKLFEQPLEES